tara:strand:+ start:7138 stop:8268 length:1131 start_codon:yes stop_codon:yes gene_type:complete
MRFAIFAKIGQKKVKPAREEAKRILANHEDPIDQKRQLKQQAIVQTLEIKRNPTIAILIDEYFAYQEKRQRIATDTGRGKHLSHQTLKQYRWEIEKHLRPYWQNTQVKQLQRIDVKSFIRRIADENTDSVAKSVLQRLKGLMSFALDQDYIDQNPCTHINTDYEYRPTERVLTEDEIRRFWTNLTKTSINKSVQLAFKLLLVTAVRRSEIVRARWDWIDYEEETLTIPRSEVKNRKEANVVPLSDLALDLLSEMKVLAMGSSYLVPSSRKEDGHIAPAGITRLLQENISDLGFDIDAKFTPHDLRRTVATMLSSQEVERENIKVVLNHSFNDVTEVYINRGYVNQKRRYLDLWARKLKSILDDEQETSNVVAIDNR